MTVFQSDRDRVSRTGDLPANVAPQSKRDAVFFIPHASSGEPLSFAVKSFLVRPGNIHADAKTDWKACADHWSVTLESVEYGGSATLDYWSGVGNRQYPKTEKPRTMYYYAGSKAVKPSEARKAYEGLRQSRHHLRAILANTGLNVEDVQEALNEAGY